MGLARRKINFDKGFSHIVFRTNSGEYFFEPECIKNAMIRAGRKYKGQYGIKIIDYCFMDNHCHFTMYYPTVDALSRFMHDMNLSIAKTINGYFERRGKAISDRFRSPVICDLRYCKKVVEYIWMNPVKAGMISIKKAQDYKFCSLFYKYRGLKDPLADSYEELSRLTGFRLLAAGQTEQRFVIDLLNALKSKAYEALKKLSEKIFEHLHTIGPEELVKSRRQSFKANETDKPEDPNSS